MGSSQAQVSAVEPSLSLKEREREWPEDLTASYS